MCIRVGCVHGTAGAVRGLKGVSYLLEVGSESSDPLEKQCVLLAAESHLQPRLVNICKFSGAACTYMPLWME